MGDREIVKEYSNGELTVVWRPKRCIHSEICVNTLPKVYRPDQKPWISPKEATTEALKAQIARCPSGALDYYMNDAGAVVSPPEETTTHIQVTANGPLLIKGTVRVTLADGTTETKTKTTAFCRCGSSKNKPYCDGTHTGIGFTG